MSEPIRPLYRLMQAAKDKSSKPVEAGVFFASKQEGALNFKPNDRTELGRKLAKLLDTDENWITAWPNTPPPAGAKPKQTKRPPPDEAEEDSADDAENF